MYRSISLALALATGTARAMSAQGWIEVERPPRVQTSSSRVVRVSSQVRTTIDGRVARVEVEEQFQNLGGAVAEGTYLYPLPGEAVFTNFSLWMGDREVRGEVMNAEQARGIYEEIVRKLKDPALLTLAGHGLVRAQIFPIQPRETRRVILRYTQLLERAGDAMRLRYSIGQRDTERWHALGDAGAGTARPAFGYTVSLSHADDFGTPYSPTHQINTQRRHGQLEITLDPDASGDVELFLPLRRGMVGTSVVAHAPGGEDGYFMLLLAPPTAEAGAVVPRDLSLVADVSGSMSGEKLEQAKRALLQALGTLGAEDRFRLIAFSSAVRHFREGFVPATSENLHAAREFVNGLQADGGTNIAGALEAALSSSVSQERLPIVVFMTDGIPSVGEQAPDRIAAMASGRIGRTRVFTFGVGHDVNTYLLDRLAKEGRGSAEYVAAGANIEVAVGSLLGKIQHPALVNLRIVESPVQLTQTYPAALPDLFYGEELVVFGRYRGRGNGQIVVEGERNGRRERFTAVATLPSLEANNDFIPRLWASRRIGELTRQIRLDGANQELIDQVRDLGLRYGILTEYTSYLVQEPAVAEGRRPGERLQPSTLPMNGLGAPAAPRDQTGKVAFDRARESAQLARTLTLAEADLAADDKLSGLTSSASGEAKRVGARLFLRRDAVWTDVGHRDSLPVYQVAPFSEAYFAVTRALPEIAPYLSVGDEIVIAGREASIKITISGTRSWRSGELQSLVQRFRGS